MKFEKLNKKRINTLLFIWSIFSSVYAQQTEKILLSGLDFEHPVKWEFMCTGGNNSNKWSTINVPSNWELEGFGEYTYGRWYKELNQEEPSKEEGFYRYKFKLPKSDQDRNVEIVFGGAMTDTEVKINGKLAGSIHQGGFYEFRYDITDKVRFGEENTLEVHVWKHSSNESVNAAERKADWWLFGGIYRPVWLELTPKSHISQVAVDPKMDGTLKADIKFEQITEKASLEMFLQTLNGEKVFKSHFFELKKGASVKSVTAKWNGIDPWTPETPNLYFLIIQLKIKGEIIHEFRERIGFRTLEFLPKEGIYVNGKKIIMKGINRHTIWPESGRSTSKQISIMDVNLIKNMNMNAVRSHYPPDEHFLEACDSLGLFVLDELAGWQNSYDTETGKKLVKEMVVRDVNHPSVIIWDNGNEGGWNNKLDSLFTQYDPQKRIVIHPWSDYGGWDTHHYPTYLTGIHRFGNGENVFFPTEFMHGTYDNGHGAGLEDFWDRFNKSPLFAGGFMWAFCDEAVKRADWGGDEKFDSKGSLAADGILGPYREEEGSFFAVKEIWAPIKFRPTKITSKFDGSFIVSNDYIYTNLKDCSMSYEVIKLPADVFGVSDPVQVIHKNKIEIPSIEPKEAKKILLELPDNFFEGDWLKIEAFDPYEREIYTWVWPIHSAEYYFEKFSNNAEKDKKSRTNVKRSRGEIILSGGIIKCIIDESTGYIKSILKAGNQVPLKDGPVPVGMKATVKNISTANNEGKAVCRIDYTGGIDHITWTIFPDGKLEMEMVALKNAGRSSGFDGAFFEDKISIFGITFGYPEKDVSGIKWLGDGPYRVWKNRMQGAEFGLWKKAYNNTITGESFDNLVYPEFKGYHANMVVADILTKNNTGFKVYTANDKVFLRLFTPELPKHSFPGSHPQPDFPEGDISFLYEIPAMRSFKPLSQQGPESQPSNIRIKSGDEGIQMKLLFDFID
ncbi:glycoside hydrolase family 2 TIM barrel-domain containing protein [Abyssalbus ytuae]|uniref:beta-galactosidase n=1 Tax=Abyssalbus ytuae TaxID=2926907 RepID=A0A9E6ZNU2_9FLAO|nr:glycoside hydrolase family 2 TIM barrel-domain containing protein [Abyssalbus ytuae]UOB17780.1 beta-galactosidase [Abyssalbus ytuae]